MLAHIAWNCDIQYLYGRYCAGEQELSTAILNLLPLRPVWPTPSCAQGDGIIIPPCTDLMSPLRGLLQKVSMALLIWGKRLPHLTAFCQSEAAEVKVMSARSARIESIMGFLMAVGVLAWS